MLIDKQVNGSLRVYEGEHVEVKRDKPEYAVVQHPGMGSIPKATEGEQVAAGWPSWLATVAGEAIKGWLPRRADSFEKLDKIGQGTYSNVYRARDLDQKKIVALKKVRFDNLEPESVRFMAREIHILRRLDHPNVIKLEGLVTSRMSCSLYLVFEYMEHDLAGLAAHPGLKFTEAQVKCYMQQLLRGLDHCHSHGVLHRDIKGSNLLIDNNGILKIADFGLATFYDPARVQPLTSRVVTLWYRPPELLLGATYYGMAVDLWSTGCILAELYAGKPIMPGRTEVEQLHKIFKLCGSPSEDYWRKSKLPHATIFKPQQPYRRCVADTFKEFPPPALALMETLLSIDPADRGSAASALRSEFFITGPLPCDNSSLPKYPPSKEFDAKMRDEEARRQGATGSKGQKPDMERRGQRESRAVPAPDANAELVLSMQKRHGQSNSKSRSEKFNPHPEEVASGFPIDPPRPSQAAESNMDPRGHQHKRASLSGPLSHRSAWAKAGSNPDDAPKIATGADLSTMSSLVAARRSLLSEDHKERSGLSQQEVPKLMARFPGSFKETSESFAQQDPKHLSQGGAGSHQKEDGRNSSKNPVLLGYGSKGHKIHYSGPLIVPSGNMDQMLKDHDRQIQEAVRRARLDKARDGLAGSERSILGATTGGCSLSHENPRGVAMEGSSESAWQKSDSHREFNTSVVSNRNLRSASHNSGFRKERSDRVVLARQNLKNQAGTLSGACEDEAAVDRFVQTIEWNDVSLRHWLDKPQRSVNEFECLHIFRQVVEVVNAAHSQGIVVHNVRPSCFVMSSFNHVSFIESASCSDSGSDSMDDGLNSQTMEVKNSSSSFPYDMLQQRCRLQSEDFLPASTATNTLSEASCMQSSLVYAPDVPFVEDTEEHKVLDVEHEEERKQPFPMKQILLMESSWYTSPEEVAGSPSSCASDIYRLGVLLFELFCPFTSSEDKSRTMSSLRHRVLPPQLLLKWSKEASFCLWLLHPEPSSRPKMGELLQSEFLNEPINNLEEREAATQLRERIEEQELLLEFLLLIQQRKQDAADKLQDTISLLCSDIEEVTKHQVFLKKKGDTCKERGEGGHLTSNIPALNVVDIDDSSSLGSRKRFRPGLEVHNVEKCGDNLNEGQDSDTFVESQESPLFGSSRLMKNFKKLESVYFLTRCRPVRPPGKPSFVRNLPVISDGRISNVATERSSINSIAPKQQFTEGRRSGWISPFLEGLCKYLSFSKLEVKADLKQGDLLNSSNLVCSISFDRDGEFFATAGVNKKIKVFECDTIINEARDIHYPVVEMVCRSKLSSICWNSYIKSQLASSNFEGVVQVWDVTRSQVVTEMREHERRVWSVDFSSVDPTLLASGSDDGSGVSIGSIKTKANICSVQFPLDSSRSIAFGSADHRIYYYDLRNSKVPLCTLIGHNKTVSYVKFVDTTNLVSASTDNTLKLWDLSMGTSRVIDSPIQSFTGHMNSKNFVGLSVANGYIATGSETNEVFVYHKAFPMPVLSYKFNNTDPLSGQEMDDAAQFISSVCWRGQSSTLVAANSTGNIKILEMVPNLGTFGTTRAPSTRSEAPVLPANKVRGRLSQPQIKYSTNERELHINNKSYQQVSVERKDMLILNTNR
uniref:Protein kinase domain-containing protein n=1 Tax=Salix viminalis TaxID=40686 RepID=A0A6N2NM79_SALVM